MLVITTGCNTHTNIIRPVAALEPLNINHDLASLIVDNNPWDFFTDFDDPNQCLLSEQQPRQQQPNWVQPNNLWLRISIGFKLDHQTPQPGLKSQFNWYKNHPEYMSRVSKRAERYLFYVAEQVAKHNLPMELTLLPIVESAYDPFAYSHGRASGMWQFIPATARYFKLKQNWWFDGRRDIQDSTEAALTYLTKLNKLYDGDWLLALAAYNSGQGTVSRAIRKNKKKGKPTDYWSLDLPKETRSYVPKLLALAKLINNPKQYDITLHPIANKPYFAIVDTQSQIDLAQAAQMAQVDINEIYRLNPGFNRWATSPAGPHRLLVPVSQKKPFEQQLIQYPVEQRLNWIRYKVRKGDSLSTLAKRFNTTVDFIRNSNAIRGNTIRAGKSLMIAQAAKGQSHYALSAPQRLHSIQQRRTSKHRSTKQVIHIVRSGDSLWSLAKQYKVRVSELARWNGMAPKDTLRLGQKLSIWSTQRAKTSRQAGARDAVVRKVGYKVRNGDSLARIAQRFNLRIADIMKWNTVNSKKYLQPGQLLTLYVDITNAIN